MAAASRGGVHKCKRLVLPIWNSHIHRHSLMTSNCSSSLAPTMHAAPEQLTQQLLLPGPPRRRILGRLLELRVGLRLPQPAHLCKQAKHTQNGQLSDTAWVYGPTSQLGQHWEIYRPGFLPHVAMPSTPALARPTLVSHDKPLPHRALQVLVGLPHRQLMVHLRSGVAGSNTCQDIVAARCW